MRVAIVLALATGTVLAPGGSLAQRAGDPVAAERQYRIARRLAAEGSAQASKALQRVVELDPTGPLADDALLDEALLQPLPAWPEGIGRIGMLSATAARSLVERVLEQFPDSDRTAEARYLNALLRLEPVPGYDVDRARAGLIQVATSSSSRSWAGRARYALAWLLEQQNRQDRALAAYQRIVIDEVGQPAATRAKVAIARLRLRDGRPGDAAVWLQEAIDEGVTESVLAVPLLESAARQLFTGRTPVSDSRALSDPAAASAFAPTPDGGLIVGSRREGRVVGYGPDGVRTGEWLIADVDALASDQSGRVFAAAGEVIYRLDPEGRATRAGSTGDFGPVAALAAGAERFWFLDRRRQRIGRLDPGNAAPITLWQARGSRVVGLVWDGRRLVALDGRSNGLLSISDDGTPRAIGPAGSERPGALAVDTGGRLAVLDAREGRVRVLDTEGALLHEIATQELGLIQPAAVAFGLDGVLHLFDPEEGLWVRLR